MYKQANPLQGMIDGPLAAGIGGFGTYALLASLLSGYGTHSIFKGRSDRALIEQALKDRQKRTPALPYATYDTPETNLEEDEDSEEISDD